MPMTTTKTFDEAKTDHEHKCSKSAERRAFDASSRIISSGEGEQLHDAKETLNHAQTILASLSVTVDLELANKRSKRPPIAQFASEQREVQRPEISSYTQKESCALATNVTSIVIFAMTRPWLVLGTLAPR